MIIEKRLEAIEKRLAILEDGRELSDKPETLELELILPEADIKGLHFNEQKVYAVFEKHNDGWWYSRDILFLSARNTENDNSRDILTEYLNAHGEYGIYNGIRSQIALAMKAGRIPNVEIALPKKNDGVKQYNGVDWWYWLADKEFGSAAHFANVTGSGNAHGHYASAVGGCAPVFCIS